MPMKKKDFKDRLEQGVLIESGADLDRMVERIPQI
jgi:hypothetical protein